MYLAQISDKELMNVFLRIADKFTIYRQAQDDVWDVYSDLDFFGKVGNDMSNGKCTWLIVTAMQHANKQQLEILQEHYGKEDFESINMILEVYKEIDVVNKFLEYKYRLIDELKKEIATLSLKPLRDLCYAHIDEYIDIEENFLDYNVAIKTQKQLAKSLNKQVLDENSYIILSEDVEPGKRYSLKISKSSEHLEKTLFVTFLLYRMMEI
ncbi:hypothetical protein RN001_005669 [Aquatica leii]|uniref:Uncharacterized protein n=1 Tax=Aquatica leii TaxID=1421715 RepID=A0AAN7Q842_9COLE|nr:hypothetical protein RN001_005669 [Aquatica leii]